MIAGVRKQGLVWHLKKQFNVTSRMDECGDVFLFLHDVCLPPLGYFCEAHQRRSGSMVWSSFLWLVGKGRRALSLGCLWCSFLRHVAYETMVCHGNNAVSLASRRQHDALELD